MRRVRHTAGTLTLQQVAAPEPGPGQLLVRTEAIGVTLPAVRALGASAAPPGHRTGPGGESAPAVPQPVAGEIAGTVEAAGPDTAGYRPGDRVTGLCFADAYAELALLHTAMASPVPDHATARDAVALVRGGLVALGALEAARPQPGETALITAAAGGIGHLALQLARLRGGAARVVAAVGDAAAKGAFVRSLGADTVLGYDEPDWAAAVGGPVSYVLDAAGGERLTPAVHALADGGRLIAYSSGGGTLAASDLLAGKTVTGFQIARVARNTPHRYAAWRDELWALHRAGDLRPAVAAAFPLEDAAEAHALLAGRGNLGKVLLLP